MLSAYARLVFHAIHLQRRTLRSAAVHKLKSGRRPSGTLIGPWRRIAAIWPFHWMATWRCRAG